MDTPLAGPDFVTDDPVGTDVVVGCPVVASTGWSTEPATVESNPVASTATVTTVQPDNTARDRKSDFRSAVCTCCVITSFVAGFLVWFFSPSIYMVPPVNPINLENSSVYFGNGCFWHTQYDMFTVEKDVFGRTHPAWITSLAGYAGGLYTSEQGLVCYLNTPVGSQYSDNGHAEVVQVQLDSDEMESQFRLLLRKYFRDGFIATTNHAGESLSMQRLDSADVGPAYRNVIGLPGGAQGKLYRLIAEENVYAARS
jgi:peptide methionine sulfoxide reductase MsrA